MHFVSVHVVNINKHWAEIFLVRYDPSDFSLGFYEAENIQLPEGIARSVKIRQAEYFYGRFAAKLALSKYGQENFRVRSGRMREPIWPKSLIGSISHTSKYACALVLQESIFMGIGIDIEKRVSLDSFDSLKHIVIDDLELEYLDNISSQFSIEELVTLIFSAKESFFKATSHVVGKYFDFSAVKIISICETSQKVELVIVDNLAEELREGHICEVFYMQPAPLTFLTLLMLEKPTTS